MTIGVPTYTIQCDQPKCHNVDTFPMAQPHSGLYQIPNVTAIYAHFGGETLPDGMHRCARCRANDKPEPPSPDQITKNLDLISNTPGPFEEIRSGIIQARNTLNAILGDLHDQ